MMETIFYYILKGFGIFVRRLPISAALVVGRLIGYVVYYVDIRHKRIVYGNLKVAFAKTKEPDELKKITKQFFLNYGQNLVEFFRLPSMTKEKFDHFIRMEGREHITEALKKNKGLILLAMHFGSWELAILLCAMLGHSYKVIVNPQRRHTKLDELLQSYRSCGGNIVLSRGLGTREMVKSLQNNEIIGLVVDQGGRDGVLVPFFDRQASMSVGAIRLGLKYDVPICFSIIMREKGPFHRLIIHPPLALENTGNTEKDIFTNLQNIVKIMEGYIERLPTEYMWFYKIWKYSKEANILLLDDGRTGHLRQSQAVARLIQQALSERRIEAVITTAKIRFRNRFSAAILGLFSAVVNSFIYQGRLGILKWFLTGESFRELVSGKADFVVSCGSMVAGVNFLVADDQQAKSIAVLKPGLLSLKKFDLVILPQHDEPRSKSENVVITKAAPNLITPAYLTSQTEGLLNRFSHLKFTQRLKLGVLLGGDTKEYVLSEPQVKILMNQLKEVAQQLNADLLVTTSRRTSPAVEHLLHREFKKDPRCPLLILANRQNIPEAVGGILGLADLLVVSGDSISMISEAASAGKTTVVFPAEPRKKIPQGHLKHDRFIEKLNAQGYIVSSELNTVGPTLLAAAKGKVKTNRLDDQETILEAARYVI